MTNYSQGLYVVLNVANEIKTKYNLNYVGTELLVYGILLTPKCDANKALFELGATHERYFAFLKTTFRNERKGYTQNCQLALKKAGEIAKSVNGYVNTAHLLMAILSLENCRAYKILQALGVDIASLYAKISATVPNKSQNEKQAEPIKKQVQKPMPNPSATILKPKTEKKKVEELEVDAFDGLGYDLTKKAKDGKLGAVIGRESETQKIIITLSRKTKNAPVLVGEAGVGKSAVIEGLAVKIASGLVPDFLKDKRIFCLDIASLLAGTRYRGDFEQKLKSAVDYALNSKNVIFYIDEIHNLVGAGSTQDSKVDAIEILKPLLSRGGIMLIGATTPTEYTKYIEKDPALDRRFQIVKIEEPSIETSIQIINGIKGEFEKHHGVTILEQAVETAVKLSDRYIIDKRLPDKAIDLIDEACSTINLQGGTVVNELELLKQEINSLVSVRNEAYKNFNLDAFKDADKTLNEKKEEYSKKLSENKNDLVKPKIVNSNTIKQLVSNLTGVPVTQLSAVESAKLLNLEQDLSALVIGQQDAIKTVAKAVRRSRANLKDPNKPIGSFIFVGPTGVGKSELTKALAKCVFGTENSIIRFDMSEYSDKTSVNKLIGVAQGYVGYEEEGLLTEKIRKKPYSIVLFDEIEKAHPDVFDLLLQVLDEGRLTDSKGKTVTFKNALIILTSNAGFSSDESQVVSFGFSSTKNTNKEIAIEGVKKRFKPEFINRLDDIVVFNKLSKEDCFKIVEILLKDVEERLKDLSVKLTVENSAIEHIVNEGFSSVYGARPLKRAVSNLVEDLLSDAIIEGDIKPQNSVTIYFDGSSINYKKD